MMFQIGKKQVGDGCPVYIIAEAGSNHNGSLATAKELVDAAKFAGADAVKFQLFRARTMYPSRKIDVRYLRESGVKGDLYGIIEAAEVPLDWMPLLSSYAHRSGLGFIVTPFDPDLALFVRPFVDAYKVASYECLYVDLLQTVLSTGKPLVVSTGGCTDGEVRLLGNLLAEHRDRIAVLHCIAKYPAPVNQSALATIPYLRDVLGMVVGYSDHTLSATIAPAVAVALGAKIIEKHFTMNRSQLGPDHQFALEPSELKQLVDAVRGTELSLGSGVERSLQSCEEELRFYSRCLYCRRSLKKGSVVAVTDLAVLRNTGEKCLFISPVYVGSVIGKTLARDKASGDILCKDDFKEEQG